MRSQTLLFTLALLVLSLSTLTLALPLPVPIIPGFDLEEFAKDRGLFLFGGSQEVKDTVWKVLTAWANLKGGR